jgi:hypothetical protein
LWIGQPKDCGFCNIGNFQTEDQMKANPIIILEDNLAQNYYSNSLLLILLLMELIISGLALPILVCFSLTKRSGTKYHFTINNSPLPSNVINDVAINNHRRSFIATSKGLSKGLQRQQMMI